MSNTLLPDSSDPDNIARGVGFAALAFFLLAMMGACSKLLFDNGHNLVEIVFYRNFLALIPMLVYAAIQRKPALFVPKNGKLLGFRVMTGVAGLFTTFAALGHLPMADATVIFMTSNLLIPVLAFFFLKEQIGLHRWSAIFIGFCGVVLVAGPTGQVSLTGTLLALAAACFHASVQTLLRKLKNENAFTVTFYFMFGGAIVSAFAMPWFALWPGARDALLFAGLAASGGCAQYCLTSAYKNAPAAVISPFNYTGLLWATGLDILVWHYMPKWPVFAGGMIIIGANLYILHRERVNKKPSTI